MRTLPVFLAVFLTCTACQQVPKHAFLYAEPETQGFSSARLDSLKSHLEESGASGMMIMVQGEVIFDWGQTRKKHTIHSIRKCLLNSLYGIAVAEGIIDLLKSRSGIYYPAAAVSEAMLRGMHMLGVYPSSGLVLVHRVDTEGEFSFREEDFYKMINRLFNAKIQ